jgi:hypothetical protein
MDKADKLLAILTCGSVIQPKLGCPVVYHAALLQDAAECVSQVILSNLGNTEK